MIRRIRVRPTTLAIAGLAVLSACQRNEPADVTVLAHVNGKPVTQTLFESYVRTRLHADPSQLGVEERARALEQLLQLEAAASQTQTLSPDAGQELELLRLELLARDAAARQAVLNEPSAQEIEAAYREFLKVQPTLEYHAAHVLVATESSALAILERIRRGENFAELAASESADDSRKTGGDLGWISPGRLPAALTDALEHLRPGEYSPAPIKTQYGWHVLRLIEFRSVQPVPLEQVKAQLVANLLQLKYQQFLKAAAANAKIERSSAH